MAHPVLLTVKQGFVGGQAGQLCQVGDQEQGRSQQGRHHEGHQGEEESLDDGYLYVGGVHDEEVAINCDECNGEG